MNIADVADRYIKELVIYCDGNLCDEKFMRDVECKIDIPEWGVDDFRRSVFAFYGVMLHKNQQFQWNSNPKLSEAFEKYVLEHRPPAEVLKQFQKYLDEIWANHLWTQKDGAARLIETCIKEFPLNDEKTWFRIDELAALCHLDKETIWESVNQNLDRFTWNMCGDYASWVTIKKHEQTAFFIDDDANADANNLLNMIGRPCSVHEVEDVPSMHDIDSFFVKALAEAALLAESASFETQANPTYSRVGNFVNCLRRQFQRREDFKMDAVTKIISWLTDVSAWEDVLVLNSGRNIYGGTTYVVQTEQGKIAVDYKRIAKWCELAQNPEGKVATAVDMAEIKRSISNMTIAIEETKKINGKAELVFERLANALEKL
jgi:hypothetical protein